MNEQLAQLILDELFSSLEALETRTEAVLQLLEQKGLASQSQLAPYLEQAGNASSVRWRAARVRIDYLVSAALKPAEEAAERPVKDEPKTSDSRTDKSEPIDSGKDDKPTGRAGESGDPAKPDGDARPEERNVTRNVSENQSNSQQKESKQGANAAPEQGIEGGKPRK